MQHLEYALFSPRGLWDAILLCAIPSGDLSKRGLRFEFEKVVELYPARLIQNNKYQRVFRIDPAVLTLPGAANFSVHHRRMPFISILKRRFTNARGARTGCAPREHALRASNPI